MGHTCVVSEAAAAKPLGARARVRAELTAEIKHAARRQLESEGASSLSLRAIAREMGMASSAIYRYFASRDELLTALIIDAYGALGDAATAADEACDRTSYHDRFVAVTQAVRSWAHDHPHEYALIYGSPVPGYAAPDDTIDPAIRVPTLLISVVADYCVSSGRVGVGSNDNVELTQALADLSAFSGHVVPVDLLSQSVQAWGQVFGLISLELFGHFNNAVTDPAVAFDFAMNDIATSLLA